MKMDMYWSQQEVFLMGTLSLFPDKLKGVPITPDGEWWYYFNCKNDEELARQLYKYKKAGYIEFEEVPLLVKYIGASDDPDDESNFRPLPSAFVIKVVHMQKVTDDLSDYLENWHNNKLFTNAAHKPDDHKYQYEKLVAALKGAYERQITPHVSVTDIYGDNTTNFYNYQPPFWETVLAPQLVSLQYSILQMDYDLNGRGQPFVDINITSPKLRRSLELAAKSSQPITDDDPKESEHRGLRIKRDGLVDYNGISIRLSGQETAALRALMERPDELRLREDIAIELSVKNSKPDNMAKLISKLHKKLQAVIGYDCIENTFGQGWTLKIHLP